MDSGSSGSLQSTSGGEDEYDSRAFMSGGGGGAPVPHFFDSLPVYRQLHQNPNFSAPSLRSDPNPIGSVLPNPNPFMSGFQPPTSGVGGSAAAAPPANQNQAAARNPKKRSRASRRAPTTVLTTDTTNFRAMVQEFTGIPSPPFNSSAFPRSRLDLFGWRSAASDAAQPPPYLRRPLAQKVQPPHPFLASSTTLDSNNTAAAAAAAASTSPPPSLVYQLPITNTSNLFNTPNQNILTSLLQSNPKFPISMNTSKPLNQFELQSNDHQSFNLGHNNQVSETLAGLQNLIPSDQINAVNSDVDKDGRVNLRQPNGSYDFDRTAMSGKMSFAATSTSGFHGGKAPENAAVRGEGMVESWLCSSE